MFKRKPTAAVPLRNKNNYKIYNNSNHNQNNKNSNNQNGHNLNHNHKEEYKVSVRLWYSSYIGRKVTCMDAPRKR